MISYDEAYQLTLEHIHALEAEDVPLISAINRACAHDLYAQVNSPSVDVSLKDGYAVHSADIAAASADSPVTLQVLGMIPAGGSWHRQIGAGEAVRILSGAPLPDSADAVIAEEFTQLSGDVLQVTNDAHPGRNILPQGSDVRHGELLVPQGTRLNPMTIGLLAAAGYQKLSVNRLPRVAILATGDEVVAPGNPYLRENYMPVIWSRWRVGAHVMALRLKHSRPAMRLN